MSHEEHLTFSVYEHARVNRWPWAALTALVLAIGVEAALRANRVRFEDLAAWQWRAKTVLLEEGVLEGECVIVGTSISFHAVKAAELDAAGDSPQRVTNLALNGIGMAAEYQLLERYIERHGAPQRIVLELSQVANESRHWTEGPYWRSWATLGEFSASGALYTEPELVVPFLTNRVSTAFSSRTALENWISTCLRSASLDDTTQLRNEHVLESMRASLGFDPGTFDRGLTVDEVEGLEVRPWLVTPAGLIWFERILARCAELEIRVTLFIPPMAPEIASHPKVATRERDVELLAEEYRERFPSLGIELFHPRGYELKHFSDSHHLSPEGSDKLTADLGEWLRERP